MTLKKTSCEGFLNLKWYPCHWMSWSNNTQVIDVPVVVGPGTRNSSIYDGPRSVRQIVIRLCRRATHRERREYEYRQCRRIFRYAPQARIQTPGAKTYLSSDVRNPSNHSCNELAYTIARAGRSAIAENFAGLCRTRKRGGVPLDSSPWFGPTAGFPVTDGAEMESTWHLNIAEDARGMQVGEFGRAQLGTALIRLRGKPGSFTRPAPPPGQLYLDTPGLLSGA